MDPDKFGRLVNGRFDRSVITQDAVSGCSDLVSDVMPKCLARDSCSVLSTNRIMPVHFVLP
jgi:uncharacterized membrane protein YcjF (UPF0283 family)